jgi:hypothetical protein
MYVHWRACAQVPVRLTVTSGDDATTGRPKHVVQVRGRVYGRVCVCLCVCVCVYVCVCACPYDMSRLVWTCADVSVVSANARSDTLSHGVSLHTSHARTRVLPALQVRKVDASGEGGVADTRLVVTAEMGGTILAVSPAGSTLFGFPADRLVKVGWVVGGCGGGAGLSPLRQGSHAVLHVLRACWACWGDTMRPGGHVRQMADRE